MAESQLEDVARIVSEQTGVDALKEKQIANALNKAEATLNQAQVDFAAVLSQAQENVRLATARHDKVLQTFNQAKTQKQNALEATEQAHQNATQTAKAAETAKDNVLIAEHNVLQALLPCLHSALHHHSAIKAYAVAMLQARLGEQAYNLSIQTLLKGVEAVCEMEAIVAAAKQLNVSSEKNRDQAMVQFKLLFEKLNAKDLTEATSGQRPTPLWVHCVQMQHLQQVSRLIYGAFSRENQSVARSEWVRDLYQNFSLSQLQRLLPTHIRENQGINDQYAYNMSDVQQLLNAHNTSLSERVDRPEAIEAITLCDPMISLEGPDKTKCLIGAVSDWAQRAQKAQTPQLLVIPYLPTAQVDDAGQDAGNTVWHWVGLVVASQGEGSASVAFLDSLAPRTTNPLQASWHQSVLDALEANGLKPSIHPLRMQRQNDTRLCGPLLVHACREIMDKWLKNASQPKQRLPDSIKEVNGQALRAKDALALDDLEAGALGLPFSVRQAWGVRF